MLIQNGRSFKPAPEAAIKEATQGIESPELVLAFASTKQAPEGIAQGLAARFPNALVVGCTTTGEILDGARVTGSLTLTALSSSGLRFASGLLDLSAWEPSQAEVNVQRMLRELGVDPESMDTRHYFCMLFIDGLSLLEESVSAAVSSALQGIPLVGGSAGDDLQFSRTQVFFAGQAHPHAAALVLVHAPKGYDIMKHQHFTKTATTLAVTRVDAKKRRVYELDGRVAASAYASALGLTREALTNDLTFMNPTIFSFHGESYVRSIQKIEDDGSITFYCAVEEGMVLELGSHEDMAAALAKASDGLQKAQRPPLFIGFNCILRALEMEQSKLGEALCKSWGQLAEHSIGFDTYGEQLNGLHINQTLVGVALRA